MDVNNEAALGGSEQQPVTQITVEGEGTLSVTGAARALAGARHKQKDQPATQRTARRRRRGA